jgi:hypothetical protein
MIVNRMSNGQAAAAAAGPVLAALALLTGLAAGTPASAAAAEPEAFLASVSCTSSTACIAVGGRAGHNGRNQIFNLSWNGVRWKPQVPVNVNHTQPNNLNSVACVSPTQCFAVGDVGNFNFADQRRLIEAWNGTAWSIQAFGNPKGTANTFLNSVSCGGPSLCFAFGDENDNTDLPVGPLVEKWDGTGWAVQPALPEPAGANVIGLDAVSCASAANCTAVGVVASKDFTDQQPLAEHWDGTSWSIEAMPPLNGSSQPELFSVSCTGSTCIATGRTFDSATGTYVPLAEFFNGTAWSVVHLAPPIFTSAIVVNGVACTSASNCYAAGVALTFSGHAVTLIEHWNGTQWSVMLTPNAPGENTLQGVTCTGAGSCMAVGRTDDFGTQSTLAMRLSGGRWSIIPTPSPG